MARATPSSMITAIGVAKEIGDRSAVSRQLLPTKHDEQDHHKDSRDQQKWIPDLFGTECVAHGSAFLINVGEFRGSISDN